VDNAKAAKGVTMADSKNDKSPLRVLVFGATGGGKTSLCNELTGRNRPTGDGASGVTDRTHVYGQFEHGGETIVLIDTVGLHEADSGTVPADRAIKQLVELLERSREGFNLLVQVGKVGRLTKQHEQDYQFFVDKLTERRIPTLLVLTGAENRSPMSSWVVDNKEIFRSFQYRDIIAACFAKGGELEVHYAPLRLQSRLDVLSAIRSYALPAPALLYGKETDVTFTETLQRVWNDFVDLAGLPADLRVRVNENAYQLLRRLGVPRKVAELAIAHIPDLVEQLPIPFPKVAKKLVRGLLQKVLGTAANEPTPRGAK
jgi:hypothetical protein